LRSEKADMNLEDLARKTEGKSYFVRDADGEAALQDAFLSASTFQSSVQNEDLTFKLFEKDFLTSAAQTDLVDEFDVDSTVGRNLKLRVFDLVNKKSVKSIELTGPDGDVVNNFVFDASTATLTVDLAEVQYNFNGKNRRD
jgi:calcium-activated chloride channel regulator 3/4